MALVSPCYNYVYVCPHCGIVFGGVNKEDITLYCYTCAFRRLCRREAAIKLPHIVRLCGDECRFEVFMYQAKLRLNIGKLEE